MLQFPMESVESSNVAAVGYDAESATLRVQFKDREGKPGATYDYAAVPSALFAELQAAESKGRFLNANVVRGGFAFKKLEPAPAVEAQAEAGQGAA